MKTTTLKEHVELIRQVFGYINQFKGKTFVIMIDSEIILHSFFPILIKDIVLLHQIGIKIIIVPGARKRIDDILTGYKIPWKFVDGIRISPPESIPFIKMAAFDVSNKVMTFLAENKTNAVIGNWVRARGIGVRHGIEFKCAGRVDKLKTDIIHNVLAQGLIPIFPNIGWNEIGYPYNISSKELAAYLSIELAAEKLFFVTTNKYGVITAKDYELPHEIEVSCKGNVSKFKTDEAKEFLHLNKQKKKDSLNESNSLLELISLAYESCKQGVRRVHIVDGSIEGVILKEIFSNLGFGIMVYTNEYAHIRQMVYADIPEVLRIMHPLVNKGTLIPRTPAILKEKCSDFVVYEVDGILHACGALHVYSDKNGEIAGIAVDETYANMNIGEKVVSFLLEKAKHSNLKKVFVLTTHTADWFLNMGFTQGEIKQLPPEKKKNMISIVNPLCFSIRYKSYKMGI